MGHPCFKLCMYHLLFSLQTSDPDVILCNSVELIRERLTVSEDGPRDGYQEEQKDNYVYDIYYLDMATPGWIENILSVQPYSQEWELVRGPVRRGA